MMDKIFFTGELKADSENNNVTIEGWANKPIVDDVGDKMAFDKVDLNRFKKNPIMFFNHNRDMPIGKWTEWKVSENGLWVKGVLSKSKDQVISCIRDLVKEGILKTLSIGFDPKDEQYNRAENFNEIKEWRLNEVSVVTMPCNVDAEFSLAKSLKDANYDDAKKLLLEAIKGNDMPEEQKPTEEEKPVEQTEEQKAEAIKSAFQDCVSAKIPKLIEEGRNQDQAIAIAMSMCREEGKCAIELMTPEMFDFAKGCATRKPESKEEEKQIEVAAPVPQPSDDPSNFGSPYIDLAKSQLALLGKISEQINQMNTLLTRMLESEQEMVQTETEVPNAPSSTENATEMAKIKLISERINSISKELGF